MSATVGGTADELFISRETFVQYVDRLRLAQNLSEAHFRRYYAALMALTGHSPARMFQCWNERNEPLMAPNPAGTEEERTREAAQRARQWRGRR